ncbi:little elongation complex subunit 2-like [Ornithodoros turicata]|uniref:little elongation complex subunit 2-like n=1 Tax=Ornithodoros turicata TaxID=34597 RepID=UPI003138B776
MAFFTRWDYKHYSLVHAEIENECYEKLVHLIQNEALPNMPQDQAGEAGEMKPIFSKLNKQEHKTYLKLLQTYNNKVLTDPTLAERKDIETLACLQRKVVQEQKEFVSIFDKLPDVLERYKTISLQASRFVQEHLEANLQRTLRYPRHYKEKEVLQFRDIAAIPEFQANVLQMGKCARVVRPNLSNHCQVPLDYEKLVKRFPPLDIHNDSSFHPSIGPTSQDDVGIKLALQHQASILIDLETLATLLDTHTDGCQWELPVVVRKDKSTGQTVACVDTAVLPEHLSRRDKNQLCYNYATRLRLTHVNVGRPKKDAAEVDPATPKRPRGRPRKAELPRMEVPVVADDDIFGEVEDLETFGVGTEPAASPAKTTDMCGEKDVTSQAEKEELVSKKVSAVESMGMVSPEKPSGGDIAFKGCSSQLQSAAEEHGLGSEIAGSPRGPAQEVSTSKPAEGSQCTCAGRMMTRRLKQQCLHCKCASPKTPAPDPPSTDGSMDSEDAPLVIDESPVEESLVVEIASPDSSPVRGGDDGGFEPVTPKIALNKDEDDQRVEATDSDTDDGCGALRIDLEGTAEDCKKDDAEVPLEKDVEMDSPESPPPASNDEGDAVCVEIDATASSPERTSTAEVPPGVAWEASEAKSATGPLPEGANVFYNLWKLGSVTLLLRHHAHAFTAVNKQTWSIFPKLEYNPHLGAEMFTEAELIKQMCYLLMIPNSNLLRVRVDALNSSILYMEDLGCTEFVNVVKTFSPDKLFGKVGFILGKISGLEPGYYILSCRATESHIKLLKATDGNRRGTFDLHCVANQRAALVEDPDSSPRVIPLDPEVVLPDAHRLGQIPLTFPPKDPKRPMLLVPRRHLKRFKGQEGSEDDAAANVSN